MPLPHDLCSQIQNGFRMRRAKIAVPHTTQNLAILSILLREGFLSSITRGTASEPSPSEWAFVTEPHRRIWAFLKYRGDRPVLSSMSLVSTPSKRIFMDPHGIRRLVSGKRSNFIKPLGMGEIGVVKVGDRQWVEAREAVAMNLGGEVVCRAR
ncbi:ribosomal protein S8 [Cantharellus anzutake]|uniref:ribosomal protein S8 n=1 Tax=Cantharellus anzutake TaxID=1750568 RepID=UPI0019053D1C|nr:ribosomal protein S8 [Cantharellus anzutake]KAF8327744.1 ribosomal protein S8 [Cantharellus anzutake]